MKIDDATREAMAEVIRPLDTDAVRDTYRRREFPRADAVKDLDKRYRWDLLHASGFDVCGRLYDACNAHDSHVDTALRSIVRPLEVVA